MAVPYLAGFDSLYGPTASYMAVYNPIHEPTPPDIHPYMLICGHICCHICLYVAVMSEVAVHDREGRIVLEVRATETIEEDDAERK